MSLYKLDLCMVMSQVMPMEGHWGQAKILANDGLRGWPVAWKKVGRAQVTVFLVQVWNKGEDLRRESGFYAFQWRRFPIKNPTYTRREMPCVCSFSTSQVPIE